MENFKLQWDQEDMDVGPEEIFEASKKEEMEYWNL